MGTQKPSNQNYWKHLRDAAAALQTGDFVQAERSYEWAVGLRAESPGRVFLTEKLRDGLSRALRRKPPVTGPAPGHWEKQERAFRNAFLTDGEAVVRHAVKLAELRPEDDAETNQPILETALFLVGRSKLFTEEPASAVPLLKGLFRTSLRTGRPFAVDFIRHDIPLTEEDRLWLAGRGIDLLDEFIGQETLAPGSLQAEEWSNVFLQLVHTRYFGSSGRLQEERAWLEAALADRLLQRPQDSVRLFRAYLADYPTPGPRADEARVRLVELLGNTDGLHFRVPHYREALGALQSAGLAAGSPLAERFERALAVIDYRRPDTREAGQAAPVWASLALESGGEVAVTLWWDGEPRDMAFWQAGEDPVPVNRFLAPACGRVISLNPEIPDLVADQWEDVPAPFTVDHFAAALLETHLPAEGLGAETRVRLALGETAAWRSVWNAQLGHPCLAPPQSSDRVPDWLQSRGAAGVQAGLVWLAIRSRVRTADPTLRAGIGELARRGDGAAGVLYEFLTLGSSEAQSLDAAFEPWMLPLLWTRPDPFGWAAGGRAPSTGPGTEGRLDLGHNDLAIVTTGTPAAMLSAWGDSTRKWRVVLDRMDRLEDLSPVALGAVGPVTLIPPAGQVHSLSAALDLLEDLLAESADGEDPVNGLMAVFHWSRLVETHNGDLLDFRQTRPRPTGTVPLHDAYAARVVQLDKDHPRLDDEGRHDTWGAQYSQRVRKAGFVAGLAQELQVAADRLDSVWGVFEGSDASWVFLDSAAIHWQLLGSGDLSLSDLHACLFSRGHRHLSLLTGAVWLREDLEDLLGTWLGVYGRPYCLSMTDARTPLLRLADHGAVPDARVSAAAALAAQVARIRDSFAVAQGGAVRVPGQGRAGEFWHQVASGELPFADSTWSFVAGAPCRPLYPDRTPPARNLLVVPVLESLEGGNPPIAQSDTRQEWRQADQDRRAYIAWRRKLCALEMASLLAGPWGIVEILDTRWWRLLASGSGHLSDADAADKGRPAAARLAPPESLTFDLPGFGPGSKASQLERTLPVIQQWLQARTGPAAEPPPCDPRPGVDKGATLLVGSVEILWPSLRDQLSQSWEQGGTDKWLLLVSETAPPGAADLVAGNWSGGGSVWPLDESSSVPAPLVWARPSDFLDNRFHLFLTHWRPALILAQGVDGWLPAAGRSGQVGALALRTMLDCGAQSLILQAEELAPLWQDYLTSVSGGRLQLCGEVTLSPDPQVLGDPPVPPCLDCGRPLRPHVVSQRLRRFLSRLQPDQFLPLDSADQPLGGVTERQLVPLARVAHLSGVTEADLQESVRVLRWAARLAGDTLSDAEAGDPAGDRSGGGHALMVPHRFAEIENALARLDANLAVLFPLWLESQARGLTVWVDLDFPPLLLDDGDLALLDRLLASVAASASGRGRLIYACPRGSLNTSRRLVGCSGNAGETLAWLRDSLQVFQRRVADVMAKAVETGDGFRVDTGLSDIRPEERDFLALGADLGLWRWDGPACPGALHLVDLMTLADSPTAKDGRAGWNLVEAVTGRTMTEDPAGISDADPATGSGRVAAGRALDKLRGIIPGTDPDRDLDHVSQRLTALLDPAGDPGLLVIKGLAGTGRHDILCRALQSRLAQDGDAGQVTFYCPDSGVAARLSVTAARCGLRQALDIRIPRDTQALGVPRRDPGLPADPGSTVVVICEAQRFEPEVRYRVAELGRGCRLLMTIDPAAATEPWEHLFLTTPRTGDIVELENQRSLARTPWAHLRELVPESLRGRGTALRRQKGTVTVDYAVNLDQCLSRIIQDVDQGALPPRLVLSGPLQTDLEFLAASLRERGWLALPASSLDRLLLPGPREMMAYCTDLLAFTGLLPGLRRGPEDETPEDPIGASDGSEPAPIDFQPLLPGLLGPEAGRAYADWLAGLDLPAAEVTLGQLLAGAAVTPWARSVLALPNAAPRVAEMLAVWGAEKLSDLPHLSTWEAWWQVIQESLGREATGRQRPLVTYQLATEPGGRPCPGGVYLCLGTEPPAVHYNVLTRTTDHALILYKDQSPLAGLSGSRGA